ncbi:MAG: hypothetical protein V7K25_24675 [Nostoc sp.]|uniref:hypothetical protein n=1 Tax=Nostoc sp. TaxID=1180 RepID=UPI002FFA2B68
MSLLDDLASNYFKKDLAIMNTQQPTASSLPGAKVIKLAGSVGIGGVNKADDVKAIKAQLHELAYTWVGNSNSADRDRGLFDAIKLNTIEMLHELFSSLLISKSCYGQSFSTINS